MMPSESEIFAGVISAFTSSAAFFHNSARNFAADIRNFAFQISYARFMRVVANDVLQRFVAERDVLRRQTICFALFFTRKRLAISNFSISV